MGNEQGKRKMFDDDFPIHRPPVKNPRHVPIDNENENPNIPLRSPSKEFSQINLPEQQLEQDSEEISEPEQDEQNRIPFLQKDDKLIIQKKSQTQLENQVEKSKEDLKISSLQESVEEKPNSFQIDEQIPSEIGSKSNTLSLQFSAELLENNAANIKIFQNNPSAQFSQSTIFEKVPEPHHQKKMIDDSFVELSFPCPSPNHFTPSPNEEISFLWLAYQISYNCISKNFTEIGCLDSLEQWSFRFDNDNEVTLNFQSSLNIQTGVKTHQKNSQFTIYLDDKFNAYLITKANTILPSNTLSTEEETKIKYIWNYLVFRIGYCLSKGIEAEHELNQIIFEQKSKERRKLGELCNVNPNNFLSSSLAKWDLLDRTTSEEKILLDSNSKSSKIWFDEKSRILASENFNNKQIHIRSPKGRYIELSLEANKLYLIYDDDLEDTERKFVCFVREVAKIRRDFLTHLLHHKMIRMSIEKQYLFLSNFV